MAIRNSTLKSTATIHATDADEIVTKPVRVKSHNQTASDAGVWTASLFLAFVAILMPAWFLGVGVSFGSSEVASTTMQPARVVPLGLGSVAIWFGMRVSLILAKAPRIKGKKHSSMLRRLWWFTAPLSVLFLLRFVYNSSDIAHDPWAYLGAVAPALLMAELSFALPAIGKHRYGTDIGAWGGMIWSAVGANTVMLWAIPSIWWMPCVLAVAGSMCTAAAAVRIWRHYEGRIVTVC